jgi:hypothetical protein
MNVYRILCASLKTVKNMNDDLFQTALSLNRRKLSLLIKLDREKYSPGFCTICTIHHLGCNDALSD